jgi:hypothetical protein
MCSLYGRASTSLVVKSNKIYLHKIYLRSAAALSHDLSVMGTVTYVTELILKAVEGFRGMGLRG